MKTLKHIFILIVTLFTSLFVKSQQTFADSIFLPNNAYGNEFVSLKDGNFLFASQSVLNNTANDFFITKLSSSGARLWSKSYDSGINDFLKNASATNDNGFVILTSGQDSPYTRTSVVTKFDVDGNVQWSTKFKAPDFNLFDGKIIQTANGNYIAACIDVSTLGYPTQCTIVTLSPNGTILSAKTNNLPTQGDQMFISAITETADNSLFIGIKSLECSFTCSKAYLLKFDISGTFIWGKHIVLNKQTDDLEAVSIKDIQSKGSIIHVLLDLKRPYPYNDFKFCYFNFKDTINKSHVSGMENNIFTLKNFLSQNSIPVFNNTPVSEYGNSSVDIIQNNGSVLKSSNFNGRVHILKYDAQNRICPSFEPAVFSDSVYSFKMKTDPYNLSETAVSLTNPPVTINTVKPHFDFYQLCSGAHSLQTSSIQENAIAENKTANKTFSIFPNPAINIVHITTTEKVSLILFDAQGKLLKTYIINNAGIIDVSGLLPGLYYLKSTKSGEIKKLVII